MAFGIEILGWCKIFQMAESYLQQLYQKITFGGFGSFRNHPVVQRIESDRQFATTQFLSYIFDRFSTVVLCEITDILARPGTTG